MFTNTYKPHVGGVAESVSRFTAEFRKRGHEVLVIAPEFPNMDPQEENVVRVPAFQNFNGSDFSVSVALSKKARIKIEAFNPEIIHTHHPFLMGHSALSFAKGYELPLVFTYHTNYEQYTHYVPGDSEQMQQFVIELATGFANMCDHIIAPSQSVADTLADRGVTTSIKSIPTGVYVEDFANGDGKATREKLSIPPDAFVVGHLGRLAPEKNLLFLAHSVTAFLMNQPNAHFLVIGDGPSKNEIQRVFRSRSLENRLHFLGILEKQALVDSYHAMDVFAFSSKSETQGMVLTEAMSAGLPVVALDAPGVREVVQDRNNGVLLMQESTHEFANALEWVYQQPSDIRHQLIDQAKTTAEQFSMKNCSETMLNLYESLLIKQPPLRAKNIDSLTVTLNKIQAEWDYWVKMATGATNLLKPSSHKAKSSNGSSNG